MDVPFVLFPHELEPDTHDLLTGTAADRGVSVQEGTGLPTVLGLVRAGVGAAFVVASVATNASTDGLVFRPLDRPPTVITAVAWKPDNTNPAVATFLRVLDPRIRPHS